LIIGVKEEQEPAGKKFIFTGYREDAEPKIKDLAKIFTDIETRAMDLSNYFPNPRVLDFHKGRIAIVYVDELPADEKYCFYDGVSYKRLLTGDHKHSKDEISTQEEYKLEASLHKELMLIKGSSIEDIDLDKLNEYIQLLNQQAKIATLKPDLNSARPFLESHQMFKNGEVTLLGMLVCGKEPAARLNFRCRVQGYLEIPNAVAGDKMAMDANVIQLMEAANAFILRNTRKAVVTDRGGSSVPEYPSELLRESVNNAFAHRDYSIDHYVSILIKPDEYIEIRNPGTFRPHLLVQIQDCSIYRVIPEAKARNPKLAHILHLYDKWEGRGRGMATLVSLSLEDKIDVPSFRFRTQEVSLFIRPGPLVDQRMRSLFAAHDKYLRDKLQGNDLTVGQQRVLAYLIKSEEINTRLDFSILLTQDNDHFEEINRLEKAGLIKRHSQSPELRPIYVADKTLSSTDYTEQLRKTLGETFDGLDQTSKEILSAIYRFNNYSSITYPGARLLAVTLWDEHGEDRKNCHFQSKLPVFSLLT
jgi:ATP-dependent DNA helicase RecG